MNLFGFDVGLTKPFFLIAGPCVIESEQLVMDSAGKLEELCKSSVCLLSSNVLLIKLIVHHIQFLEDSVWSRFGDFG